MLLDQLLEMGFRHSLAERALRESGATNLETAINWVLEHQDDPETDKTATEEPKTAEEGVVEESTVEVTMEDTAPEEAKSLKCNQCQKLFRNHADVEFHAAKTGHTDFQESVLQVAALTEEEKQKKMEELRKKIEEKKQEKAEEEKKKTVELEKHRRKHGQEMQEAKHRMKEKEMKDLAEERKRQKMEDLKAKNRVLDQIKADREARKQNQQGAAGKEEPAPMIPPPQPAVTYDESKLQIRLTNGATLTQAFGSGEQLAAVRLFVQMNRTDGLEGLPGLMTPFPRKVFTEEDMETPLSVLGLVPSAVLVVTR